MLLDVPRLNALIPALPVPISDYHQDRLRRDISAFLDNPSEKRSEFVAVILQRDCGFDRPVGTWSRGSEVDSSWTQRGLGGEAIRPRHLWRGSSGTILPVFIDQERRLGIGRGRRASSQVLQWLRKSNQPLALLTNGHQWRLIFAGLDYSAYCEWDVDQWLASGQTTQEFDGFRALFNRFLSRIGAEKEWLGS